MEAAKVLRTLHDALDELLGNGTSNEGANRNRAGPADSVIGTTVILGKASTTTALASSACVRVFETEHLLTSILAWLFDERHFMPSRMALGKTVLVNKQWWQTSRQVCFWRPLLQELLPIVGMSDESIVQHREPEGHFVSLCKYGKCLTQKRVATSDSDLFRGLQLHVEMWDAGLASARIYSAVGSIKVDLNPESDCTRLRLVGPHRKEWAGPIFSVADLDPMHRRLKNGSGTLMWRQALCTYARV